MGLRRALTKAAKKAGSRGLKGNRDSQGNFVTKIDTTDPMEQLRQEAFGMEQARLEQLQSALRQELDGYDVITLDELSPEDAALHGHLLERLELVDEVLESREIRDLDLDTDF